jgi:hypothetical protein
MQQRPLVHDQVPSPPVTINKAAERQFEFQTI